MKSKWLLLALLLSLAINLAALFTIVFHWFKQPPPFRAEFGIEEPMNPRLRPTPEQLERIKECRMHFHQSIEPLQRQIQAERKKIVQLLMQPEIDTVQVITLQDSISNLHQQIQRKVVLHMIEQRQFLDENQYQAVFRMMGRRFMNPDDDLPHPGMGKRGFRNRRNVNE